MLHITTVPYEGECAACLLRASPLLLIALLHSIQHKKALYPNKEAKSTLYSNKSLFMQDAQETGERAPKPLPAGGLAPAVGSS